MADDDLTVPTKGDMPAVAAPVTPDNAAAPTDPDAGTPSAPASQTPQVPGSFDEALSMADADIGNNLQANSDTMAKAKMAASGGTSVITDAMTSMGLGVVKAFVNAASAIPGQDPNAPGIMETPILKDMYADSAELDREKTAGLPINSVVESTSQFAAGLIGAGKAFEAVGLGGEAVGAAKVALEAGKGAAAAATVFDPQQQRLSNLLTQSNSPLLNNAVTQFLASQPGDSDAMGRLKNALEGAGMDVALASTFSIAMRSYKALGHLAAGAGDPAELAAANADLTAAAKGRTPGTGWGGDDQVAPTDPSLQTPPEVAAKAPPEAGSTKPGTTPAEAPTEAPTAPATRAKAAQALQDNAVHAEPEAAAKQTAVAEQLGATPAAAPASVEPAAKPSAGIATAALNTAKLTGERSGKASAEQIKAISDAIPADVPSVKTNDVTISVMPHKAVQDVRKAAGGQGTWLGFNDPKTGTVAISDKVLSLPPAQQAKIIAHETGHALMPSYIAASGRASLPGAELKAASQALRPEAWDGAGKLLASTAKGAKAKGIAHASYLNSSGEQFADAFALWKTDPAKMAEVAPTVKASFDQHFQPWIDTDLTTLAGDVKAHGTGTQADIARQTEGAAPQEQSAVSPTTPLKVRFQPEDADVAALTTSADADAAAIQKYGSLAAATENGYNFAKANLPWQKLSAGGDGLQAFTAQVAQTYKAELDAMKGGDVLHDATVNRMVSQRVALFNEDPTTLLGEIQAAGHNANGLVANMEAGLAIADKMRIDLMSLQQNINMGNFAEFGGNEQAAKAALPARLAVYLETVGNTQAMRSALGRGMRRLRGDFQLTPEDLAKVRSMDPDAAMNIISLAGGNPHDMARFATKGVFDQVLRAVGSMFTHNLLWGWKTHFNIIASNTLMLMLSPASRAVGSFAMGAAGTDIRTQAMREYRYMFSAMEDARKTATETYLRGDSVLSPHTDQFMSDPANGIFAKQASLKNALNFAPPKTAADVLGNTWKAFNFLQGQPGRVIGMEDEFFKTISYRSSIMSRASMDADKQGLTGPARDGFMQQSLDNAFGPDGQATDAEALRYAQANNFQQPLLPGTLGAKIAQTVNQHPMLRFILPFTRSPINMFRTTISFTPGLNMLQGEFRQMIRGDLGPMRQADAYGRMVIGSMVASSAVGLVLAGRLTGSGPQNPNALKALQQTGWQADSIHVGDTYVPYERLEPFGTFLGVAADIGEVLHDGTVSQSNIEQITLAISVAVAQNLNSKTYLSGISNALDAIGAEDHGAATARALNSFALGLVPFSSLMKEVNPDPYMHDVKGLVDSIKAGIPGFSSTLPPRRDAFGAPVLVNRGLTTSTDPDDVVDAEQQRMLETYGIGISPEIARPQGTIDLRGYVLPDGTSAFDKLQDLSQRPKGWPQTMKQALATEIKSPAYQRLVDGQATDKGSKLWTLSRIVAKYRMAAKAELLNENPPLRAAIGGRATAMRAAQRAVQQGQAGAQDKYNSMISNQLKGVNGAFGMQ